MASQGLTPDGGSELVKAPAELVIAPYALVEDVGLRVTPDLKRSGNTLLLLRVGARRRLGGSALAQVLSQLGDEAPDIEDPAALKAVFQAVQDMVRSGAIVSCHDVSDGGLIVTLLEMAFAGDKGWRVDARGRRSLRIPVRGGGGRGGGGRRRGRGARDPPAPRRRRHRVGPRPGRHGRAELQRRTSSCRSRCADLHATWEETSYQLERLQANPECADEEWLSHRLPAGTRPYRLGFDPDAEAAGRPRRRGGRTDRLGRQAEGRHPARGGQQRRPGDGRRLPGGRVRALGRHHDRPHQRGRRLSRASGSSPSSADSRSATSSIRPRAGHR